MDIDELHTIIKERLRKVPPNTLEAELLRRTALKAAYKLDEYPVYRSLESTWKLLEGEYPEVDRDREGVSESPLSSFMYYVSLGYYPPPEIMLCLLHGFETYFNWRGEKSLDEVFFNRPYKKSNSPAALEAKDEKYRTFHELYVDLLFVSKKHENTHVNLVSAAEEYISKFSIFWGKDTVDPDSFLRNYRRWKRSYQRTKS